MNSKLSAALRHTAMRFLTFLPDKPYISLMYRVKMKKRLNWKNPQTFNEKIQWLKLYDRRSEYTQMVDKYEAKKYVADRIGEEYIIPTLGVWDKFEDIDFDKLPNQFVLKCTHDSGGLAVCRDKSAFDINAARKRITKSLNTNYYLYGREWPYRDVKPRILAEKYMENHASGKTATSAADSVCSAFGHSPKSDPGLTDYKFYCFDGEPKFLYISQGLEDHETACISFLTLDWQFAPFRRSDYRPFNELPSQPEKFNEMVQLCKVLAKNHTFLRVDLYQIGDKVYFSELTFSPCSGFMPFKDARYDLELGSLITLPRIDA